MQMHSKDCGSLSCCISNHHISLAAGSGIKLSGNNTAAKCIVSNSTCTKTALHGISMANSAFIIIEIQIQTLLSCNPATVLSSHVPYSLYLLLAAISQHADQRTRRGVDPTFIRHSRKTTQGRPRQKRNNLISRRFTHTDKNPVAMLPSRGIARSLPSPGAWRQAQTNRLAVRNSSPPEKEKNTLAFWRKFSLYNFFFFWLEISRLIAESSRIFPIDSSAMAANSVPCFEAPTVD